MSKVEVARRLAVKLLVVIAEVFVELLRLALSRACACRGSLNTIPALAAAPRALACVRMRARVRVRAGALLGNTSIPRLSFFPLPFSL